MKNVLKTILIIFVMSLMLPIKLYANDVYSVYTNTESNETKVGDYNNYNDAINYVNSSSNRDLTIRRNGSLVYGKNAIGYVRGGSNVIIYHNSNLTSENTYITGNQEAYGSDVAILDYNPTANALLIKISDVVGWVTKNSITVTPLIKNPALSYYKIDDHVNHVLRKSNGASHTLTIGPDITGLAKRNYYSYDGKYFYTSRYQMLADYKNNTYANAANNKAYYNYYLHLPMHTKTEYSPAEIENYIYTKTSGRQFSLLKGEATSLFLGQEQYGTNAVSSLSLAFNESAYGTSTIALNTNNLYGHNATDTNPGQNAHGYNSVSEGIFRHANLYVNYSYSSFIGSNYRGGFFGNKGSGMNVKYASDPHWGEKAAANYYELERTLGGNRDFNSYRLAIKKTSSTTRGRKSPSDSSNILIDNRYIYEYTRKDIVVTVIGEETYNGVKYYKVISDYNFGPNHQWLGYNQDVRLTSKFNWENSYVYVLASDFELINNVPIKKVEDSTIYDEYTYTYDDYLLNSNTVKLAQTTKQVRGYASAKLEAYLPSSTTIPKSRKVVVLMDAKNSNNEVVAYLIQANQSSVNKYWVSPSDLEFITGTIGRVNLQRVPAGQLSYVGVYHNVTPNEYPHAEPYLYGTVFAPVVGSGNMKNASGTTVPGLQVEFDGVKKWVIKSDEGATIQLYEAVNANNPPTITAKNIEHIIGDEFNPLNYATATDKEDGNITNKIVVEENNVNINTPGVYTVKYSVTDNNGTKVEKTINVTVINKHVVNGYFYLKYLKEENNKMYIAGYNVTTGYAIDNPDNVSFKLRFVNLEDELDYHDIDLEVLTDKSQMDRGIYILDNKDYTYSWFIGEVDYNNIPVGDYELRVLTETNLAVAESKMNNSKYKEQATTITNAQDYTITTRNNYQKTGGPVEVFIRETKHLLKTSGYLFNTFYSVRAVEFLNNEIRFFGTSYAYDMDLSNSANVNRNIIFENKNTRAIHVYDLGVSDEYYKVALPTADNLGKDQAWFDKTINIEDLPIGEYTIYVQTKSNTIDYNEMYNSRYLQMPEKTIGNKIFKFIENPNNYKIEIEVKEKN